MQNSPVVSRKRAKSISRNEERRNREMGKALIQNIDEIDVYAFKIASKQKLTIISTYIPLLPGNHVAYILRVITP